MKFNPAYGYVPLKRDIVWWSWYRSKKQNPKTLGFHLIFSVNHKKNQFQNIDVYSGQTVTSIDRLADETGLSFSQVRTALDNLKKTQDIICVSTNSYTVITLWGLAKYIDAQWVIDIPIDMVLNNQMTNKSQTNNKQIATNNNNINNYNNSNNLIKEDILKIENSKVYFQTICFKYKISKKLLMKHFDEFFNINYAEKKESFGPDDVKLHFARFLEKNKRKLVSNNSVKKNNSKKIDENDDSYFINR